MVINRSIRMVAVLAVALQCVSAFAMVVQQNAIGQPVNGQPIVLLQNVPAQPQSSFDGLIQAGKNVVKNVKDVAKTGLAIGGFGYVCGTIGSQYRIFCEYGAKGLYKHKDSWPMFMWGVTCAASRAAWNATKAGCSLAGNAVKDGARALVHAAACGCREAWNACPRTTRNVVAGLILAGVVYKGCAQRYFD